MAIRVGAGDVSESFAVRAAGISGLATAGEGLGVSSRDLMRAFIAISRTLNLGRPLSVTLDLIAEKVSQTMGHKYCAVLLANRETGDLLIEGHFGLSEKYVSALNGRLKQRIGGEDPRANSVTAQAYRTRMPVYAPDITVDPRFGPWREAALQAGYKSIVALPLLFRDEAIGVLNCYDEPREYTEDQVEALMLVAEQAASAVGIARLISAQGSTIARLDALNKHVVSQHALLERSERTHEALTALLLEDRSLDDITATLSQLLDAPAALQDENLSLLSHASPAGDSFGGLPADENGPIGALLRGVRETQRARTLAYEGGDGSDQTVVVAPVDLGGHGHGYLSAPLAGDAEEGFFLRTLEQACTAYALYAARQQVARETEERIKGDLLADLLAARFGDEAEARERAYHLGLDFSRSVFRVLVVRHEPLAGYLERRGHSLKAVGQARGRLLSAARGFVSGRAGAAGMDGDLLVALLPGSDDEAPQRLAGELLRLLSSELPDLRARVGVSGACAGPADLTERYAETRKLLELAESLGTRERAICHDDWKVYALLLRGQDRQDLLDLAHEVLDPLLLQDDGGRSYLLETLQAYLENGLSPTRAAKALHVHHNTVKYRLKKISSSFSPDLDDLDGVLTAKLALMVRGLDTDGFDAASRGRSAG